MSSGLAFILPYVLFSYVIAAIMPSWRWLAVCALAIGGFLTFEWVQHWIAAAQPGYKERIGDVLGIAIFFTISIGFASGVVVRGVSLIASARGRPGVAFAICIAGLALPTAIFVVPEALDAWKRRPAAQACTDTGFRIGIAHQRLVVPADRMFAIYRGRTARDETYYMQNVANVRALCGLTANGAERVKATNLSIRFERLWWGMESACLPSPPSWAAALCAAAEPIKRGPIDETDYPITAYVFSADEVRLGDFLGSKSTYQDSQTRKALRPEESYVQADIKTPDGNPLTFLCHPQSDGTHWCSTSYLWADGAHLNYSFRAKPAEQIVARGQRIDETLRAFVAGLGDRPN